MTPQHIILAIGASSFVAALIMFYWCEFGKGGVRATRNELDVEVELNVKLLKQVERLDEYSNYVAGLLTDHRDKCPIFHPELTAPTFDGAEGRGGDVSGHARPHVSPDEDARAFFIERLGEGCRFLRHTDGRLCEGCRKAEAIIKAIVL